VSGRASRVRLSANDFLPLAIVALLVKRYNRYKIERRQMDTQGEHYGPCYGPGGQLRQKRCLLSSATPSLWKLSMVAKPKTTAQFITLC